MDVDCICLILLKRDKQNSKFQSEIAPYLPRIIDDLFSNEKPRINTSEILKKTPLSLLHVDTIAFNGLIQTGPREIAKFIAYHVLKIDVTKVMPGMKASTFVYDSDNDLFNIELIACALKITHWP